jgi:transcriptional regulator with XRE-family HTH domain
VDVSDTIQARHYTAKQAALLQHRPSDFIEAANSITHPALQAHDQFLVHVNYSHAALHAANVRIVDVGAVGQHLAASLTAGTKVIVQCTSSSTTAPELSVDMNEYQPASSWSRWACEAKKALQKAAANVPRPTTAAARRRVERLSSLQAAFGFTIQDLAAVLGITRPQLYKWLDGASDIKLQEASRTRLAAVERMAKEWMSRSTAPLSSVSKEPLKTGGTVFELLSAAVISEAAVVSALDELVGKLQEQPKTSSQRLRDAGFTRRPSVRSLPADE